MHASPADLAQLFATHAPFVRRLLRRFGVREADVPDACQDVFLVVQRKLPEFEGRAAHRTWIFRISVRIAADYRKRAHRRYERFGDEAFCEHALEQHGQAHGGAEPAEPDRALARRALRALAALDEDKRRVFVLHELEELTMSEVAAALGCPLKTAFSRFYAARRALQAELGRGLRALPWAGGWWLAVWPRKLPAALRAVLEHGARLDPTPLALTAGTLGHGAGALAPIACSLGAAIALASVAGVELRAADPRAATVQSERAYADADVRLQPWLQAPSARVPRDLRSVLVEPARAPAPSEPLPTRARVRARAVPADRASTASRSAAPPRAEASAAPPSRAGEWLRAPARAARVTSEPERAQRRSTAGLDEVLAVTSIRDSLRLRPPGASERARYAMLPLPPRAPARATGTAADR